MTLDSVGRPCLAVEGGDLAPGTDVTILYAPDSQPARADRVAAPRPGGCGARRELTPTERYYTLALSRAELEPGRVYFGVAAPPGRFGLVGDQPEADLDGDGEPERFRVCTSAEGLHLSVWSGAPLTGRRRWHRYYYLGYDVEPSCEERDARPTR